MQNDARTVQNDSHKIRTKCSEAVPDLNSDVPQEKKNLGALAGATEADSNESGNSSSTYQAHAESTMFLCAKERHKRAATTLGFTLTLNDRQAWASAAIVWEARLEPVERYRLARSVMAAMSPEDNEALILEVLGGAGFPIPPFLDALGDARFWAEMASPAERRAYCLAAFQAMPRNEQRQFVEFASGAAT